MKRVYVHLMAQSWAGGTIQIGIGTFLVGMVGPALCLVLFGWGSPGSVVSDVAGCAAVTALTWFFCLPRIAANELTIAQFELLQRSWLDIIKGKQRSTRPARKVRNIKQILHPRLHDHARDISELSTMLQELEMCFGFWRDIRRRQGSGFGTDGTFRSVRTITPLVNTAVEYQKMYAEVVASLQSMNSEIVRLRDSLLDDAGQVLLEATELRAAAFLAKKAYIENWLDDNADYEMRMYGLSMHADWMEQQAQEVARRRKALWTLYSLDGRAEPITISYTPGPYSKN